MSELTIHELRDSKHLALEKHMRALAREHIESMRNLMVPLAAELIGADAEYARRVFLHEMRNYCDELLRG